MTNAHERWMGWAALAVIAAIAVLLHHDIGLLALTGAVHDDALFFRLATYIRRGEWLGPYSQMTLAKGPMFSILAAGSWWAGAPIKTVEFIVYLGAAAVMTTAVRRFSGSWALAICLFAALAFDPLHWDASMMRLLRDPLFGALSLAVVAMVALLALDDPAGSLRRRTVLAMALGLTSAAYWLTREESSWLFPAVAVALAYAFWCTARSDAAARRRSALSFLLLAAVAAGAFAVGLLPVIELNLAHYGTADTTEYRAGPFQDAYGALTRITVAHRGRYVPVPRAARALAYSVSPAAAELRLYLEGGVGRAWTDVSCSAIGNTLCEGDMAGGWFMWALRDAAALAGHYRSAHDASAFYARMAREIDAACESRRIPCGGPRHTFAPPLSGADIRPIARSMIAALRMVTRLEAEPIGPLTSSGDASTLAAWQKGLGRVAPPENPSAAGVLINGWIAAPSMPSLGLSRDLGDPGDPIPELPAPDVDRFMQSSGRGEMVSKRFSFETSCIAAGCRLVVREGGAVIEELPVASLAARGDQGRGGVVMYLDSVQRYEGSPAGRGPNELFKWRAVDAGSHLAEILWPILWGIAVLGLGMHLVFNRRDRALNAIAALALTCLAAVFTRAFITSYIQATSWVGGVSHLYLAPAYGFGVVFAVCGSYLFLRAARVILASRSQVSPAVCEQE